MTMNTTTTSTITTNNKQTQTENKIATHAASLFKAYKNKTDNNWYTTDNNQHYITKKPSDNDIPIELAQFINKHHIPNTSAVDKIIKPITQNITKTTSETLEYAYNAYNLITSITASTDNTDNNTASTANNMNTASTTATADSNDNANTASTDNDSNATTISRIATATADATATVSTTADTDANTASADNNTSKIANETANPNDASTVNNNANKIINDRFTAALTIINDLEYNLITDMVSILSDSEEKMIRTISKTWNWFALTYPTQFIRLLDAITKSPDSPHLLISNSKNPTLVNDNARILHNQILLPNTIKNLTTKAGLDLIARIGINDAIKTFNTLFGKNQGMMKPFGFRKIHMTPASLYKIIISIHDMMRNGEITNASYDDMLTVLASIRNADTELAEAPDKQWFIDKIGLPDEFIMESVKTSGYDNVMSKDDYINTIINLRSRHTLTSKNVFDAILKIKSDSLGITVMNSCTDKYRIRIKPLLDNIIKNDTSTVFIQYPFQPNNSKIPSHINTFSTYWYWNMKSSIMLPYGVCGIGYKSNYYDAIDYLNTVMKTENTAYRYGIWLSIRTLLWANKDKLKSTWYTDDGCQPLNTWNAGSCMMTDQLRSSKTPIIVSDTLAKWLDGGDFPAVLDECYSRIEVPDSIRRIVNTMPQSVDDFKASTAGLTDTVILNNHTVNARIWNQFNGCLKTKKDTAYFKAQKQVIDNPKNPSSSIKWNWMLTCKQ